MTITRDGCGTTRLCVATPEDCDPAGNGTCTFVALEPLPPNPPEGTSVKFSMKGDSSTFVTVGLTISLTEVNKNTQHFHFFGGNMNS